ncbi:MAG: aspartate-semialdehyde dehydrogenase [Oscillospiraceae bacterium]
MNKLKVGIIGATGMVGQRFILLLTNHPWFEISLLAASPRSVGKTYQEAVDGKWAMNQPIPKSIISMKLYDINDIETISSQVDFIFSAVNMNKNEIRKMEEDYAKHECVVISNNSAHRDTADVPMIIPELNYSHMKIINAQRKRLGTKRGFIAVKSNCSIQSYVPMLYPLNEKYGVKEIVVSTYQAISGAGKTFDTFPEIQDNIIPYIEGEEEKSEREPLKIWGHIENNEIIAAKSPLISVRSLRVPVSDGHLATVFASFEKKPKLEDIKKIWREFKGLPQTLMLPSAPKRFIHYFDELNRPQPQLDREIENGMAVSVGRLYEDTIFDISFIGLSHNTIRGAAGGAILLAELLYANNYITEKTGE